MLARTGSTLSDNAVAACAAVIAAMGAGTLLGAWFFQYVMNLAPCPLCLQQRWPYYLAVPLAVLVAIAAGRRAPPRVLVAGLAVLVVILLASVALGVYHAGAEWKWWDGPQDCAATGGFAPGAAGDLMRRMQTTRVVRCDEAAWRDPVLSLSLAGWNVVISLALAGVATGGIASALRGQRS
jgi:disulfide bond formation protein DsbB